MPSYLTNKKRPSVEGCYKTKKSRNHNSSHHSPPIILISEKDDNNLCNSNNVGDKQNYQSSSRSEVNLGFNKFFEIHFMI